MCGIGPVGEALHIRPRPAGGGSAESCGNVPAFNTVEILPCAEGSVLHMGNRLLKTDVLGRVAESCGKHGIRLRGRPFRMCSAPATGKVILGSSEWCWWDSCGDPGRGRVQICHKGAPGRDRPRMKPRNINDSLPAFRLDPGLCGRFGQLATPRAPWGGRLPASARSMTSTPARTPARRAVADRADAPFDRAGPVRAPLRAPRRRPNPRDRHLTHENVPLADDLAGYPAISAVK